MMGRLSPAIAAMALAAVTLMGAGEAHAWPWSDDMMNQPSIKPQERIIPMPRRSVPITGVATPWADRDETEDLINPIAPSGESIRLGRKMFRIYCAACHGLTGRAESPVADKIGAPDLTDPDLMDGMTEGWVFGTITFGSVLMPPYGRAGDMNDEARGANDLSVEERWNVVNYVTHQLRSDAAAAGPVPVKED